ncbi:hypothetical protein [Actinoallomurus sp. NBC_01490]|uniref:hypothetical protein n=1 Tax=Actinoallomurus sp. NBC_01490 TaxID=2903557 RepID=UPI002E36AEBB|nr:hypothetical protein [Actinoallomurus sp. NBC_01490]
MTQKNVTVTGCEDVVQVNLMPDAGQALALERTLHAVNKAANWVSAVAFDRGVPHLYELRKYTYGELKSRGLGGTSCPACDQEGP